MTRPPPVLLRRRTALLGTAAALACPAMAAAPRTAFHDGLCVVHQPSLAASAGFAQAWRQPRFDATDLAALLYRTLPPLWQQPQALLMGLTDAARAFCIERAAYEQGWRTVWRAGADTADAGTLADAAAHRLAMPRHWRAQPLHGDDAAAGPLQAWLLAPRSRLVAAGVRSL